ncbi:MAG TPA: DUF4403 family protein [Rhizomicrobium sp.]|jgi:hypothetical protein|nr:DUF4403 family protein [Rhizomicrobium sp.]
MKQPVQFLAFLFPLLLLGCGIEAPRPALTPPRDTPQPPLSTLSVTLVVPEARIADLINAESQNQIADLKDQEIKCPLGRCRLDLLAVRTGPAEISAENSRLAIKLPFRLNVGVASSGFLSSFGKAQGDAQGLAVAATPLSVGPDWKLHSQLSGRIELSNAHLRIGPLVTNVAEIWDQGGENLEKPIWHMLDAQISRIEVKPQIEALWVRAFAPIAIGRKPVSWLVLKPESVALMQPAIAHGALTLSLALAARGEVLVQDQVPSNPPTPLPKPAALSEASNRFKVAIPFLLPYAEAERLALSTLTRNPPRVAGMNLAFSSLHILPSREDVVVETRFCARPAWDITGWFAPCAHLYMRGRPAFDPVTRTVRVTGLHYDITSANAAARILQAVASEKFADMLARTLVFDVSRQIAHEEDQTREQLAMPHGKAFSISAHVESFGAPVFSWTRDGFLAFFSATGTMDALFKP